MFGDLLSMRAQNHSVYSGISSIRKIFSLSLCREFLQKLPHHFLFPTLKSSIINFCHHCMWPVTVPSVFLEPCSLFKYHPVSVIVPFRPTIEQPTTTLSQTAIQACQLLMIVQQPHHPERQPRQVRGKFPSSLFQLTLPHPPSRPWGIPLISYLHWPTCSSAALTNRV